MSPNSIPKKFAAITLRLSAAVIYLFLVSVVLGVEQDLVSDSYHEGDFKLLFDKSAALICVDSADFKVVKIAAGNLAADVERVTGIKPQVSNSFKQPPDHALLIGTLGSSPLIDSFVRAGKLDVSGIKGKWESFLMAVVPSPMPGMKSALVIVGSDRRGTAFGVYDLSERIGVSPWYWWADVTPRHRDSLVIHSETYRQGPPSVKYRGIFINDEDWGMQPWAANTFDPDTHDIGPKTYARIFELLLRLKANCLWPAMHGCTKAFNLFPENKQVADDYAIVMGSSHCEPMLRNNVGEWDHAAPEKWNYQTNRNDVRQYWEQRIEENGKFENLFTLGMRGVHDGPLQAKGSMEEKVKLVEQIFSDQREILGRLVNPDLKQVPQIFIPYKEVLGIYQNGLKVPDDVTLVWVDDNHGYIRQLSNPQERQRPGGSGVYYHVSYWGAPQDYLWLCTTPPALIGEEMSKAYDYGARTLWVLNVGDLKPAEIDMDFFLRLAWDVENGNPLSQRKFLNGWVERNFGKEQAPAIADVLTEYYRLNYAAKPEHLLGDKPNTPGLGSKFSAINYGDEMAQRLERFSALLDKANAIYAKIPSDLKDAFYELVLYPVRASGLMNQKVLCAEKNRLNASQGRASIDDCAEMAKQAYLNIQSETDYYNTKLAGGKWNHMMSYAPRNRPVFSMPDSAAVRVDVPNSIDAIVEGETTASIDAIIEGETTAVATSGTLPGFNALTKENHFIDVFNTGQAATHWTARPNEEWIKLSATDGGKGNRIWVTIDWVKVPRGIAIPGTIKINGGGKEMTVRLSVFNPEPSKFKDVFVESNGCVSMEAEHFTRSHSSKDAAWKIAEDLGRSGDAMTVFPTTTASVEKIEDLARRAPSLEYDFQIFEAANAKVITYCLPTHSPYRGRGLRYAVSIDDGKPSIVNIDTEEMSAVWATNVLQATALGTSEHTLSAPGRHTLKIWMVDPGIVLDKIAIDLGGMKPSYFGPPETHCAQAVP